MILFSNKQIKPTCSFKDKDIELSFLTHSFAKTRRAVPFYLSGLMLAFLLFGLPDLFFYSFDIFFRNLIVRCVGLALCLGLYFAFGKLRNCHSYLFTVTAIEFCISFFYILLLTGYPTMNLLIKCLDLIVIMMAFFTISNKWLISVIVSLTLLSGFILFFALNIQKFSESGSTLAGFIYVALAFILGASNFYRINYYQRSQFYNITVLKKLINTDTLTGANTRAKFNEDIKKQINHSKIYGRRFCVTIFDIDNFKHINDTFGHIEGDKVLTKIAETVNSNKRPKDILTRWGGEEFVILFPATGLPSAVKITERLRVAIASAKFDIGEQITCSFGVTEFRMSDTHGTLLHRADKLMYDAKSSGKNTVVSDNQSSMTG